MNTLLLLGSTLLLRIGNFMPPRDDPDWLQEPIDHAEWQVLYWVGQGLWWLDRQMLQFAIMIHSARKLISDPGGLIQIAMEEIFRGDGSDITKTLVTGMLQLAFTLVVLMLALRAIGWDLELVKPGKLILYFFACVILFSTGGLLFTKAEQGREWLQEGAHVLGVRIAERMNFDNTGGDKHVGDLRPPPTPIFIHMTRVYTDSQSPEYSGVTLAAFYLGGATQDEVNDTPHVALPAGIKNTYFMNGGALPWPDGCDKGCRQAAMDNANNGDEVLFGGVFAACYAILEATMYLIISFAVLIVFLGTPLALAFSFFTGTEIMANSLVQAYIGLMQKTWAFSLILGIFSGAMLYWARTTDGGAFVGMAFGVDVLTLIFVFISIGTIKHALHTQTNNIDRAPPAHLGAMPLAAASLAMRFSSMQGHGGGGPWGGMGGGADGDTGSERPSGRERDGHQPGDHAREELGSQEPGAPPAAEAPPASAPDGAGGPAGGGHSRASNGGPGPSASAAPGVASPTSANKAPRSNPTPAAQGQAHAQPGGKGFSVDKSQGRSAERLNPDAASVAYGGSSGASIEGPPATLAPTRAGGDPARASGGDGPAIPESFSASPVTSSPEAAGTGSEPGTSAQGSGGLHPIAGAPTTAAPGAGSSGSGRAAQTDPTVSRNGNTPAAASAFPTPAADNPADSIQVNGRAVPRAWTTTRAGAGSPAGAGGGVASEAVRGPEQIRAAIAQAVANGGTARSAAADLGVPGEAWGGHYGTVQSVIRQAPRWGLSDPGEVQNFLAIAQQHDPVAVASGLVPGLAPQQQALLERVSATTLGQGQEQTGGRYLSFLRDAHALPTEIRPSMDQGGAADQEAGSPAEGVLG